MIHKKFGRVLYSRMKKTRRAPPGAHFTRRNVLKTACAAATVSGASTGARKVELCDGHARIGARRMGGEAVVSVSSEGLRTAFLALSNKTAAARL